MTVEEQRDLGWPMRFDATTAKMLYLGYIERAPNGYRTTPLGRLFAAQPWWRTLLGRRFWKLPSEVSS